jgi:GNAT superfamily N-acetyltransferase
MDRAPPLLRAAQAEEAEAITELALRSKRLWGYSDEFMAVMAPVMALTTADVEAGHVEVPCADDVLLGFFRLQRRGDHAWLEDLFVHPDEVGKGYGRRLLGRAAELGREWGVGLIRFESDPHAEGFYLRLGAVRVGMSPSAAMPGREIPLMEYPL